MYSGPDCQYTSLLSYVTFALGALLGAHMTFVLLKLSVSSLKQYLKGNNYVLARLQTNTRRKAHVYRLAACITGSLAAAMQGLSALFTVLYLGVLSDDMRDLMKKYKVIGFCTLTCQTMLCLSMYVVYAYFLQLAESLGAVSTKFSVRLVFLLLSVALSLLVLSWTTTSIIPAILGMGFVSLLGEMLGDKINAHLLRVTSGPPPNGIFSLRSTTAQRSFALGKSLKVFTRTMRNSVFLYFMMLTTVCTLDFMSDVAPDGFVCISFGAVITSIYLLQSTQAQFLRMRSDNNTPTQVDDYYPASGEQGQRSSSSLGASVLSFFPWRCWRRCWWLGQQQQQQHTTTNNHHGRVHPGPPEPYSSTGCPLSTVSENVSYHEKSGK